MLKWVLLSTVGMMVCVGIYVFIYLGGYKEVTLTEITQSPLNIVYVKHFGAYHLIGPSIEQVEKWAKGNDIRCHRTFGEFLDDPGKIDENRLRAHVGCIVDHPIVSLLPEGFLYRQTEEQRVLKAEFLGAPSIGPFKVYPKAQEYLAEKRLKSSAPPMEIYQAVGGGSYLTEFLFPIDRAISSN